MGFHQGASKPGAGGNTFVQLAWSLQMSAPKHAVLMFTPLSPVTRSCATRPMKATIAKRPLLISWSSRFFQLGNCLSSGARTALQPRMSQGLSAGGLHTYVVSHSRIMMVNTTWKAPPIGNWVQLIRGLSETGVPAAASPSGCQPAATWNQPKTASMQTRPCFSSTARQRSNCSSDFPLVKPAGSQQFSGNGPPVPSKISGPARNVTGEAPSATAPGNHISEPVVPVTPFWNIIPMMANIARRPFAISEFRERLRASGSSMLWPVKPSLPLP
mmetsp:Transcript_115182/g.372269  ORF Transcript_115182/g.372269 Transcript_115182/m.372269 type:complete len:272 (-) Transcript_115182:663-1478(-)